MRSLLRPLPSFMLTEIREQPSRIASAKLMRSVVCVCVCVAMQLQLQLTSSFVENIELPSRNKNGDSVA